MVTGQTIHSVANQADCSIFRHAARYEEVARPYIPSKTGVLFVADSRPAIDLYFYFPKIQKYDWLWVGMMRAIYRDEYGNTNETRSNKEIWLTNFKDDGYRRVDAIKEPVCKNPAVKRV